MSNANDLPERASNASIDAALAGDIEGALTLGAISQIARERANKSDNAKPVTNPKNESTR